MTFIADCFSKLHEKLWFTVLHEDNKISPFVQFLIELNDFRSNILSFDHFEEDDEACFIS